MVSQRAAHSSAQRLSDLLNADGPPGKIVEGGFEQAAATSKHLATVHLPAVIGNYTDFLAGIPTPSMPAGHVRNKSWRKLQALAHRLSRRASSVRPSG